MLLGSGELGKEFVISAQRLGQFVIAVDNYEGAPAMQVADQFENNGIQVVSTAKATHLTMNRDVIRDVANAQKMAKKVTDYLGGSGLFGVEFFLTKKDIYFSELSPRPHDTGMVTLASQNLTEFDLHLRAILGLLITEIRYHGPTASAVILANRVSDDFKITGLNQALKIKSSDVRLFGKPTTRKTALAVAKKIKIKYL